MCFTINNPTGEEPEQFKKFYEDEAMKCRYMCWTHENTGPGEGTPHYQGYVEVVDNHRISWYKKNVDPRAHFEKRMGPRVLARDYCDPDSDSYNKDNRKGRSTKKPFMTLGEWHEDEPGARSDILEIKRLVDAGATQLECCEAQFGTMSRCYKYTQQYRQLKRQSEVREPPMIIWLWGPTGCGKTRTAVNMANGSSMWFKDPNSKWFDGLDGHDYVIMDDFRAGILSFAYILRLTDRYPIHVEQKGASVIFNPKVIIFTCPESPQDCFDGHAIGEDIDQLLRRITLIKKLHPVASTMDIHRRARNRARARALLLVNAAIDETDEPPAAAAAAAAAPPAAPPTQIVRPASPMDILELPEPPPLVRHGNMAAGFNMLAPPASPQGVDWLGGDYESDDDFFPGF
jgi:hypothetical protein